MPEAEKPSEATIGTEAELAKNENKGEEEFMDLTKNKDGGVLKTIIKPGVEPGLHPAKGDTIFVHYNGVIKETGKKFDDSRARDQIFCFSLGKGQVIKGWDLCIASMCRGEICRLECRPDYAYGATGSPPKIPGNQTLLFEIELLRWEGEDLSPERDGTITKTIITEGKKFDSPPEHGKVKVHIVGKDTTGRLFYDRHLEFILGEGSEYGLPDGVDKAIRRMNRGEKCKVILKGHYAYGLQPPAEYSLGSMAVVHFTIFMKNYEKEKASWELTDKEKLEKAQKFKERGTDFLNQGKFKVAINKYSAIILLTEHAKPTVPDEKGGREIAEAFEQMYLAGLAYQYRKDFDEAIDIFQKCAELDPENKAAAQKIIECRQQKATVYTHQRKKFRGMFDKLADPSKGDAANEKAEATVDAEQSIAA